MKLPNLQFSEKMGKYTPGHSRGYRAGGLGAKYNTSSA